ncbi:MAG: hypothetical protein ACOVK2_07395 [Candidatus Fonsibacter sp.]|jgi:hypothetical protein
MKAIFKINSEIVLTLERPCVDVPSSILNTIRLALLENMMEDLDGVSPIEASIIKLTWSNEIDSIERELVLRN